MNYTRQTLTLFQLVVALWNNNWILQNYVYAYALILKTPFYKQWSKISPERLPGILLKYLDFRGDHWIAFARHHHVPADELEALIKDVREQFLAANQTMG